MSQDGPLALFSLRDMIDCNSGFLRILSTFFLLYIESWKVLACTCAYKGVYIGRNRAILGSLGTMCIVWQSYAVSRFDNATSQTPIPVQQPSLLINSVDT